jgi:hypothetical protein
VQALQDLNGFTRDNVQLTSYSFDGEIEISQRLERELKVLGRCIGTAPKAWFDNVQTTDTPTFDRCIEGGVIMDA